MTNEERAQKVIDAHEREAAQVPCPRMMVVRIAAAIDAAVAEEWESLMVAAAGVLDQRTFQRILEQQALDQARDRIRSRGPAPERPTPESRHPCVECGNDYAEGYCQHTRSEREHGHPKSAPVDPVHEAADRVRRSWVNMGGIWQNSLRRDCGGLCQALDALAAALEKTEAGR